jgi:hypothetical protein
MPEVDLSYIVSHGSGAIQTFVDVEIRKAMKREGVATLFELIGAPHYWSKENKAMLLQCEKELQRLRIRLIRLVCQTIIEKPIPNLKADITVPELFLEFKKQHGIRFTKRSSSSDSTSSEEQQKPLQPTAEK